MFILFLVLAAAPTTEVEPPGFFAANEELRAYLVEAAEKNPALHMRYAEWQAALQRIPQVTALDDPQLTYNQFLKSDLTRFGVSLMQMFPWFGTLRARGEQAAADADAALSRLYAERNRLFQDVKEAYFEYAFLGQSVKTTESQAQLLREMEDIVATRYSLGLATEADVLRVQIEESQIQDQYNGYLQQRSAASARLSTLLGREASGEELPWPQETLLPSPPPPAPIVLAQLRVASPELGEMDRVIESREKGIELAKKKRNPNVTVGLEFNGMKQPEKMKPEWPYMLGVSSGRAILANDPQMLTEAIQGAQENALVNEIGPKPDKMSDEFMISVGLNLPIWPKKIRGGIEEAKEMEQSAVSEKRSRTLTLDAQARQYLFEIQDGLRRYNLSKDILIPRAQQTLESLQNRYSAGETGASFLDVLGTVQNVLTFQLDELRALRDVQMGAARLERAMGTPWSTEGVTPKTATEAPTEPAVKSEPLSDVPPAAPPEPAPSPSVQSPKPEAEPLGPSVPPEPLPESQARPTKEDSPLPLEDEPISETKSKIGSSVKKGRSGEADEADTTPKPQANRHSVPRERPRSRGRS